MWSPGSSPPQRRAPLGLAAAGSPISHGSGDYVLAFSTHDDVRSHYESSEAVESVKLLRDDALSPLFQAVRDATEEAVINSLLQARTLTGHKGRTVEAIDPEQSKRSADVDVDRVAVSQTATERTYGAARLHTRELATCSVRNCRTASSRDFWQLKAPAMLAAKMLICFRVAERLGLSIQSQLLARPPRLNASSEQGPVLPDREPNHSRCAGASPARSSALKREIGSTPSAQCRFVLVHENTMRLFSLDTPALAAYDPSLQAGRTSILTARVPPTDARTI
jgi:hypothetical protein